jgi:hypothetical protein
LLRRLFSLQVNFEIRYFPADYFDGIAVDDAGDLELVGYG